MPALRGAPARLLFTFDKCHFQLHRPLEQRRSLLFDERPDVVAELLPFLEPWIELGAVSFGERASPAVLKGLAELGYVAD